MAHKDEHELKVYPAPGGIPNVLRINYQRKWLSYLGYHVGGQIVVSIMGHRLLIEPASNRNTEQQKITQSASFR